jgi:hypothetical protein
MRRFAQRSLVYIRTSAAAWPDPEHIGKLNFYVNAVDDLLRRTEHGDGTTIGILLAADRDDVAVQYAPPRPDHAVGDLDLPNVPSTAR